MKFTLLNQITILYCLMYSNTVFILTKLKQQQVQITGYRTLNCSPDGTKD